MAESQQQQKFATESDPLLGQLESEVKVEDGTVGQGRKRQQERDAKHADKNDEPLPYDEETEEQQHNSNGGTILGGFIDTMQDVATNVKEAVADATVDFQEAVLDKIKEVKELFVDELQHAADATTAALTNNSAKQQNDNIDDDATIYNHYKHNHNHNHNHNSNTMMFLDMGLTHNLSLLPSDVVDASQTFQATSNSTHPSTAGGVDTSSSCWTIFPKAVVSVQEPEGGSFLLPRGTSTIIDDDKVHHQQQHSDEEKKPFPHSPTGSLATIALMDHDPDEAKPDELKAVAQLPPLSAYLLLLLAVICISSSGPMLQVQDYVNPVLKIAWRSLCTALVLIPLAVHGIGQEGIPHLTWSHWFMVLLAAFACTVLTVFFVLALKYTSVGNALIFSNSQSLILLVGNSWWERT